MNKNRARFDREQVRQMRRLSNGGMSFDRIAMLFGVSGATIWNYVNGVRLPNDDPPKRVEQLSGDVTSAFVERWVPKRVAPVLPRVMPGSSIPPPPLSRLMAGR